LSLIYDVVDGAFRIFMWMLLDPAGRTVFYVLDAVGLVTATAYLIWDYRRDHEVENGRRPSNPGAQRQGAEGKDEGSPR
jgi:hypothetical protein